MSNVRQCGLRIKEIYRTDAWQNWQHVPSWCICRRITFSISDSASWYSGVPITCKQALCENKVVIKIPENNMWGGSSSGNGPTSLFLYIYTVFVDKDQYLIGITRKYRYNIAPTTSSSRVVYPAECYIARLLMSGQFRDILQGWCCTPKPILIFQTISMCVGLSCLSEAAKWQCIFCSIFPRDYSFISLYNMLSVSFELWTLKYNSVGCVITQAVQLQISVLSYNLNEVPLIQYVLSPFASLKRQHKCIQNKYSA
jgi:hypothetical protein